ncbi:MAG TPA: ribosome assembly RNA-binding protein YhbY [Thermoanaerobaculia bacterium]|jgi:RNA-binding protein|nr:ribosome assembly RNA-binding protein YhbY [Thermoanaerobaculia bacterium]
MKTLSGKQRQFLKGIAHALSPIVRVGKGGVTESVIAETRKSLESHELIKVRIEVDESAERKSLAERLATATDAHLAGTIGKIAILYRERDEEPAIRLP